MPQPRPYLITDQDAEGEELHALSPQEKVFEEVWLQEVLFKHPSILPIELVDKEFAPLIPIGREIASIDNLFVSPKGLLTIVETKLWRNPEAHRTVVAQILDYAKGLATWSYKELDKAVQGFMQRSLGEPRSLFNVIKDHVRNWDVTEIEFQDLVQSGLTDGRFALLMVGDRIFPGATQLAEIIQSAPHLQFSVNFVELQCYRLKRDSNWPLVVFPGFVAKTKEVERAVVRIAYKQEKPEVQIETPPIGTTSPGHTSLPAFIASLPPNAREIFQLYIEKWMKAGYTVYWGIVGFSLRISWNGKKTTMFDAYPGNASFLKEKKAQDLGLPEGPYNNYRAALMASPAISSIIASGKTYVTYDEMSDADIQLLLSSTDTLVHSVFGTPAAGA
jgi:hypothetical protein